MYASVNRVSIVSAPSHYLNQCRVIINWTLRNKLQWLLNQNTNLFNHGNASENIVCEIAAILSRGRWVNALALGNCIIVMRQLWTIWMYKSHSTTTTAIQIQQNTSKYRHVYILWGTPYMYFAEVVKDTQWPKERATIKSVFMVICFQSYVQLIPSISNHRNYFAG